MFDILTRYSSLILSVFLVAVIGFITLPIWLPVAIIGLAIAKVRAFRNRKTMTNEPQDEPEAKPTDGQCRMESPAILSHTLTNDGKWICDALPKKERLNGMSAFCNFCPCADCKSGAQWLSHAQTDTGEWICDVCYLYDQCTTGENRAPNPCKNRDCKHRPKIVSEWSK